jgi:RNA polymerase sigma factor (sigma-70 family)
MAGQPLLESPGPKGSSAARRLELLSDARLLETFISEQDAAAFEVLVTRHGPRVLRVCRHVLGRSADADDAFQATFMVLARKASAIRDRISLGHWLHGVAHRVAVRSRANATRRRQFESKALPRSVDRPSEEEVDVEDLRRVLHEEIDRLPARLREPLLLCYLEGRTNEDAARLVGCPPSTLKERLARGRESLRSRLARRDVVLTLPLLLLLLPSRAPAEEVPPWLVEATIRVVKKRPRWTWGFDPRGGPEGGPRILLIVVTAAAILGLGAAVALAAPTPRRGTWLAWIVETARKTCH